MKIRGFASASVLAALVGIGVLGGSGCGSTSKGSGFDDAPAPTATGGVDGSVTPDNGQSTTDPGGGFGGLKDSGVPSNLDAGCATATATATRQPVYMSFVLDGSGSMLSDSKWTAVVAALDAIFDDFKTKADPNFGAGLITFSDKLDTTCGGLFGGRCTGPYPTAADVPIGFVDANQHGKLRARIDTSGASGDTPTRAALTGAYSALERFTPAGQLAPGGKKVLVILTDGVPSDGPGAALAQAAAAELTKAAPLGPITTFVIGVGIFPSTDTGSFDPALLGSLAKAGGAAPAGCNPDETSILSKLCYFEVNPAASNAAQLTQKFIDAINQIRGQVASCEFKLQTGDAGAIDPGKVNVVLTSSSGTKTTVNQDAANGWTYDNPSNPTKVVLHGTSCARMTSEANISMQIVLGCATQIPQ